jgi:hypothetical protein
MTVLAKTSGNLTDLPSVNEFGSWKPVQLGICSEIDDNQRRREAVNTEVVGFTALEAVTRQRLMKTQQTEKTEYVLT